MANKKKKKTSYLAWHFLASDMKLGYGDNRTVRVGRTIEHKGTNPIKPCYEGLHASLKVLDAAGHSYMRPILCRVRVEGEIKFAGRYGNITEKASESDKLVATKRTVLWRVAATRVMNMFPIALGLMELEHGQIDAKLVRAQARQLRNVLLTQFPYLFRDVAPTSARDMWSSDFPMVRAACGSSYPSTVMTNAVDFSTLTKKECSATFRKLIGMERREELEDEVVRIGKRLNTLAKMSRRG